MTGWRRWRTKECGRKWRCWFALFIQQHKVICNFTHWNQKSTAPCTSHSARAARWDAEDIFSISSAARNHAHFTRNPPETRDHADDVLRVFSSVIGICDLTDQPTRLFCSCGILAFYCDSKHIFNTPRLSAAHEARVTLKSQRLREKWIAPSGASASEGYYTLLEHGIQ